MVLFPLPTKATPTDEWASPANIVRFGDGYEERSPDGLNRPRESWNVEVFYASDAAAETLQNFLLEHGQHKPFQWKPPRDAATAQNYVITGAVSGSTRRGGGDKPWFWTRSMRFDRWYGAVSTVVILPTVTISAPTSVDEDSIVDAVIARSGATTSSLTVNYVVSGTAISGADYSPLSGTATIPIGSGSVNVPVKALTDSLTEGTESIVITLSSNPNYLLGAVSSATIWIQDAPVGLPGLLVMQFEGANNSTTFIDSSSYARIVTPNGTAKLSTADPIDGVASGVFDGSGYLTVPASNDWTINGVRSVSFKFKTSESTSYRGIIARRSPSGSSFSIGEWVLTQLSGGSIGVWAADFSTTTPYLQGGSGLNDGNPHSIEWMTNNSGHVLKIDGNTVATATISTAMTNLLLPLTIGTDPNNPALYSFIGKIDDLVVN